jgi:hypothetical protein
MRNTRKNVDDSVFSRSDFPSFAEDDTRILGIYGRQSGEES